MRQALSGGRRGFTLIELIVVLAIIAIVAGMVLPLVANVGRSADMAATAKTQADLTNNLQMFFVMQKRFPQGMDSLLEIGTTSVYGPKDAALSATAPTEATQTTGLPVSGPSLYADLTVGTLDDVTGTAEYYRSFSRCGFDWVYDHQRTVVNSNYSAGPAITDSLRNLAKPFKVAEVTSASAVAKKLFPGSNGVIPTNTRLVALGIGPSNSALGKTITQSPIYPGCDGRYYGRFVAIFQVFATGERAVLVGIVDSYGRSPDYSIQQYNESLPDGSRQG